MPIPISLLSSHREIFLPPMLQVAREEAGRRLGKAVEGVGTLVSSETLTEQYKIIHDKEVTPTGEKRDIGGYFWHCAGTESIRVRGDHEGVASNSRLYVPRVQPSLEGAPGEME